MDQRQAESHKIFSKRIDIDPVMLNLFQQLLVTNIHDNIARKKAYKNLK